MVSADEYSALRHTSGVIDRSAERGRLWLSGRDRRSYLQGLLTNDIEALGPGMGCYAAYLTAQGRMIADMRVFELGDALLVDLAREVSASVRDRWGMFIFSEDVRIEDRSDATTQLGVYGPTAARAVADALAPSSGSAPGAERLDEMPIHACAVVDWRGEPLIVLRSDDAGVMGFDLIVPEGASGAIAEGLRSAGAVSVSAEAVDVCRVEAGRPRFGVDMTTETIPLEAGLESRAISQTKGCYVGQEVIIRVLHRGQGRVARRLVGVALESSRVPARGAVIRSGDRDVGSVTSAVLSLSLGRAIALGYVHRDFTAPGTPVTVDGAAAEVRALPFV